MKKMIQILKCFIISFFITILIISLAGMYKFNYLANKEGYDADGNKIDVETLVPISNTFEHDKIYEGIYSWGHEVHSFTPCNSKASYWVGYYFAGRQMNKFYKENHINYLLS
ncbi:MAG: hypothetical protein U9N33_02875 [Campylobacterota bacterium]|nr:hypothetical protein [Campylobacterota bacterium]